MAKKNQHVVPHPQGWAVKGEGNQKASSVHSTQREAIGAAREIARNQGSEMCKETGLYTRACAWFHEIPFSRKNPG